QAKRAPPRQPPSHTVVRERHRSPGAPPGALKEVVVTGFPAVRPRRLRRTPALRRLAAHTSVRGADLVLPMLVKEGIAEPVPGRAPWTTTPRWSGTPRPRWRRRARERTSSPRAG